MVEKEKKNKTRFQKTKTRRRANFGWVSGQKKRKSKTRRPRSIILDVILFYTRSEKGPENKTQSSIMERSVAVPDPFPSLALQALQSGAHPTI